MAVNVDAVGRTYGPFAPVAVTAVKIAEFVRATGALAAEHVDPAAAQAAGYSDVVAPATFAVAISQQAEFHVVTDPEVGVDFSKVVHADQRFVYERPLVAGDLISPTIKIANIVKRGGIATVTTEAELVAASGEKVAVVTSTLAVREGE